MAASFDYEFSPSMKYLLIVFALFASDSLFPVYGFSLQGCEIAISQSFGKKDQRVTRPFCSCMKVQQDLGKDGYADLPLYCLGYAHAIVYYVPNVFKRINRPSLGDLFIKEALKNPYENFVIEAPSIGF